MALPVDELELISKKLTFAPDYTRFRSVCKAWRSAAPKHPQTPWLVARNDAENSSLNFYRFSFEGNKFIQFPHLSNSSFLSSFLGNPDVFVRSSRGWLFLLNRLTSIVSLFNPFTNSIINLPNLPNYTDYKDIHKDIYGHRFFFILTSDPGDLSFDCFAVIHYSRRLRYCKVGCNDWIDMPHPDFDRTGNIHICCYSGQFFITSRSNLFVLDFGHNPSVRKLVSFSLNDVGTNGLPLMDSYLVESDGDLLLVLVDYINYNSFKVFKLDFGSQMVKLVELKSLGDKSLFLSDDASFSLSASKYPGCKENSIYLTKFLFKYGDPCVDQHMIIHDFEKQNSMFTTDMYDCGYPIHFAWFAPNLLT